MARATWSDLKDKLAAGPSRLKGRAAKQPAAWIVVLNDGTTWTDLAGCTVRRVACDDNFDSGSDADNLITLERYHVSTLLNHFGR